MLELQMALPRPPTAATSQRAFVLWVAALLAPVPPRPLRPGGLRPAVLKAADDEAEVLRLVRVAFERRAVNGPPPAPHWYWASLP